MKKYLVLTVDGMFKELDEECYESTYELLRDNVDGVIEHVSWITPFAKQGIDLWVNDEGKLLGLDISLGIRQNDNLIEVLNGNIVFARNNKEGETLPLDDEDISFIKKTLQIEKALIQFKNPITGKFMMKIVPVVEI
jgi:hypothetical protein